jgi:peptide-methionine (R)-S-oxide reductase
MAEKVIKTDEEWKKQLTPEQYHVARKAGTEPAFTGKYWKTKETGTFTCACCGQPLFSSEAKFDSGTGWPSFSQPLDPSAVETHTDRTYGMARTEARCARCDAHLGHVFEDGPVPTGLRYCMNSASLDLKPASEKK